MPGSSSIDLIHSAFQDLNASIQLYLQCSATAPSGQPLALDTTITTGLLEASNLFASLRPPVRTTTTEFERVVSPIIEPPPPTASLQRVISTDLTYSPFPTSSLLKVNVLEKHLLLTLCLFKSPLSQISLANLSIFSNTLVAAGVTNPPAKDLKLWIYLSRRG